MAIAAIISRDTNPPITIPATTSVDNVSCGLSAGVGTTGTSDGVIDCKLGAGVVMSTLFNAARNWQVNPADDDRDDVMFTSADKVSGLYTVPGIKIHVP